MAFTTNSTIASFGGQLLKLSHSSAACKCTMNLNLFLPPQAKQGRVPVLFYLSGLTCTGDNCAEKGFFQHNAAKRGIAVVYPDTSPRGLGIKGEDEAYDFGSGAGFYIDAKTEGYRDGYNMETYIAKELPEALFKQFDKELDSSRVGITGHSMGGHGALTLFLKYPGMYRSVSAFAPISNPSKCPWGEKAFNGYLGSDKSEWAKHDATELVKGWKGGQLDVLIDVGTADNFYQDKQLLPEHFVDAAKQAGVGDGINLRMQDGHNHSYFTIATFADDHVDHAAKYLLKAPAIDEHASPMRAPFMRIPYTGPLPPPTIIPASASSLSGALDALQAFVTGSANKTLFLTGAGISVASGLADYRGPAGTYTLNRNYRPIYYGEFLESHRARQRYWARSFLGWPNLARSGPNAAHRAVGALGKLGVASEVVTQNVDSFHPRAHPALRTTELHGALAHLVCVSCGTRQPRSAFQADLARLNPAWAEFLADALAAGALDSEDPKFREARRLRANPDGDVHLPDAPWETFRYPACRSCLERSGRPTAEVDVVLDADGAWAPESKGGVLKPGVVMFGESTEPHVKAAAENAVDAAARVLVVGSSLATYSAWRLVRRAQERGMPIGVLNLGGIRGEDKFFAGVGGNGEEGVRAALSAEEVLPKLVERLGGTTE